MVVYDLIAKEGGEMARKGGAPENLDPVRSKEEAKKRGRNGGKKSGEARRRKRDAQQAARLILNLPVSTEAMEKNLKAMKIDEEDYTNRVALFARAFAQAMTGDVKAMQFIIEMAGETPDHQLEQKRFDNEVGKQEGSNNAVDDWVNSIPDVKEGGRDGDDGSTEET